MPSARSNASLVLALAVTWASPSPSIAQPVIWTGGDPYLDALETPWRLPEEMMERLARRAVEYETAALSSECRETTHRVKYPRSGQTAEGNRREATYLFTLQNGSVVPVQGRGKSIKSSGKSSAPPAHAWTQLFARHNQPYFAYRDVGEVSYAFGKARKIQFRGAVPFGDGDDIREWEGTVLVDSISLLPLELDAQPLHLWPRLEHQRLKYLQAFRFNLFGLVISFKKKPVADRVHVRFDMQHKGLTLPVDAYVERVEKTQSDQAVVRSRVVANYEHRFGEDDEPSATAP
jgi:hypothetical protein